MRRTWGRHSTLVAVCWLLTAALVQAQDAPLERTLAADALGPPVVWVPSSLGNGLLPFRIAAAGRVPIVFEAITHAAPLATVEARIDLTGKTVREALDLLVGTDPRYVWTEQDGVIVIRPAGAAADAQHPLRLPVGAVATPSLRPTEAMDAIAALVGGRVVTSLQPTEEAAVAVDSAGGSLLDLIVAVARAHREGFWMTPSTTTPASGAGVSRGQRRRRHAARADEPCGGDEVTMLRTGCRVFAIAVTLLASTFSVASAQEEIVYYHTDAIGSVRMITDESGSVIANYHFLPFGEAFPVDPQAPADKRMFTGAERDAETTFDYLGARYYQSQTGRLTSPDPITFTDLRLEQPQRWNLYTYAANNPLKYIDPDGRDIFIASPFDSDENLRQREWMQLQLRTYFPSIAALFDPVLSLFLPVTQREQATALGADLMTVGAMTAGRVASPLMTQWGWTGSAAWRNAVRLLRQGGTLKDIAGKVPSKKEALQLLREAGATVDRIEPAHLSPNPHSYPHINFSTASGAKGTIRIQGSN